MKIEGSPLPVMPVQYNWLCLKRPVPMNGSLVLVLVITGKDESSCCPLVLSLVSTSPKFQGERDPWLHVRLGFIIQDHCCRSSGEGEGRIVYYARDKVER
jgi:hypothetical protein